MSFRDFRLYAAVPSDSNLDVIEKLRFNRILRGYCLFLTDKAPDLPEIIEINGDNLKALTEADEVWLKDCLVTAFTEQMVNSEPEALANMKKQLDQLEKAFEEEEKRINKEKES